ncbi:cobalamin biosynthesis protein [Streptomyces sp. NPDC001922]|uniref:cobalamin biosynthesis protein n=1 Tax=Streptomyces sp. NPDC001922 TaxID=3364624 RepID=UPI0036832513
MAGSETGVPRRPPSLVVGVGARRGAPCAEALGLIRDVLAGAGLAESEVAELATVRAKADEAGLLGAAERLGVPLRAYPADALAAVEVPHPSEAARAAVGAPGVAEAAALLAAGPGAELVVPKRKSVPEGRPAMVTAAVARRRDGGHDAAPGAAAAGAPPGAAAPGAPAGAATAGATGETPVGTDSSAESKAALRRQRGGRVSNVGEKSGPAGVAAVPHPLLLAGPASSGPVGPTRTSKESQ